MCQEKIMKGILDINEMDRPCNCDKRLKKGNFCWWGGNCRQATVVYELLCKETKKSYIGKTQRYFKTRTMEHVHDVWKVIVSGRAKFGENWYGSGGYSGADAFAKHFAHLCRDCRNYNEVRAKMKEIMQPQIVWKGERIQCMKSARTSRCKLCMKERREILKRYQDGRKQLINDNSDIFSSCKCEAKFHKFIREVNLQEALKTRSTQKKVNSSRLPKQKRKKNPKRFSCSEYSTQKPICQPCNSVEYWCRRLVSSQLMTPFFDLTPMPGTTLLQSHSPQHIPQNIELAQVQEYQNFLKRQPQLKV